MSETNYKSFAYLFSPLTYIGLTTDLYRNLEKVKESHLPYWCHIDKPSKNLQQQITKKFNMPKNAKQIIFADEVRARCVKVEDGIVLIMHYIEPSNLSEVEDFPTLRFWITEQGIVSFSSRKVDALYAFRKTLKQTPDVLLDQVFIELVENLLWELEETLYQIDERLNQIETSFEDNQTATQNIMSVRQDIIYLRRYVVPQRDAFIMLANKLTFVSESSKQLLKELSDNMQRQVESIEMLRERAVVVQDSLANQIAEVANRRMYILTIIMLIFTPPFFIMGMFSMYMPTPGMNSRDTWWILVAVMFALSLGLFKLFKWKRWL